MRTLGFLKALQWRGRAPQEAALALGCGALAAYSHPGIGMAAIMPIALIALAYWAARSGSFFAAARIGCAFGLGIFWVITISAREWALVVPMALTLIGTGLYALPQALLAHALGRRAFDTTAFFVTAAAWKLCMDFGDYLGFPTKGEGLAAIAGAPVLMGGARLVGSSLICGIMVAGTVGCGVRLAQLSPWRFEHAHRALHPLALAMALLLGSSGVAHLTAPRDERVLKVGIPQMNVPSVYFARRMQHPELSDAFEDIFAKQLRELADVDLLALTESYDGSYPLLVPKVRTRFQNYARAQQQAVLLSSYLATGDGGIYNAVGSIDANGKLVGVHRKVNLAPFGEVEYEHGVSFQPAEVLPGVRVGILICQESLLADGPHALVDAGANLLVSPTSDISFHSGLLSFEHLALARMRAIETGRSLVWASAGGPSGVVDRWGNFVRAGPLRAPAAARTSAELHDDLTPYLRTVWIWRWFAAGTLIALAVKLRVRTALVPGRAREVGTLRGCAELTLATALVWGLSVGSAGAVEIVNGTPDRARQSVDELVRHTEPYLGVGTLTRFQTDLEHSAGGALAYYLDFYGQRTVPSAVQLASQRPTLAELAEELRLRQGFPTQIKPLDFDNAPRVAAIVRSKAGEFCVVSSDRTRRFWLFRPTQASVFQLSAADAAEQLESTIIVPAALP
ncbi:MAG TPA: nitrilase-related carbon-nitrogen hydrolase [Polyangiaceae bacterium]|nr:nitrilase-related carbon-nitrogen hydrolase [Polyangiaceae bacterium]